jgi:hypothetical protein
MRPELEAAERQVPAGLDAWRVEAVKEILRSRFQNVAAIDAVDTTPPTMIPTMPIRSTDESRRR